MKMPAFRVRDLKADESGILLWANVAICLVIAFGFFIISFYTYERNRETMHKDIEYMTVLNAERMRHRAESAFAQPLSVAFAMSGDKLFEELLAREPRRASRGFMETICGYLRSYKERYHFDTVTYASAKTGLYYHPENGIDRTLERDDPDDAWFFRFMREPERHSLTIEEDQTSGGDRKPMLFVNCKMMGGDDRPIGIIGVGIKVEHMQELFECDPRYRAHTKAYLLNSLGTVEQSMDHDLEGENLFGSEPYAHLRHPIMTNRQPRVLYWWYDYDDDGRNADDVYESANRISSSYFNNRKGLLVAMYSPSVDWHLIVNYDISEMESDLSRQFGQMIAVIATIVAAVLLLVTSIIRKYNAEIMRITQEKIRQASFQEETEKLYAAIFEIDITHDRVVNDAAKDYIGRLGLVADTPYSEVITALGYTKVHPDHRESYMDTLSPDNIADKYGQGIDSVSCEYLIDDEQSGAYHWMRTMTRAFVWDTDKSLRVLVYRQNIDKEKIREHSLMEELQHDGLSGLYNKIATQELVKRALAAAGPADSFAFFIMDIDNFKSVNDTCGHAAGDAVIADFASRVRRQFRAGDIVGRIGGDEFVVFVPAPNRAWVAEKAATLGAALWYEFDADGQALRISSSIGVAITPEAGIDFETIYHHADSALYVSKQGGKNRQTIWSPPPPPEEARP